VRLPAPLCRRLSIFREPPRPAGQGRTWRDYWTFAYHGFFGVSINQVFFTIGLHYTNVTHSSIIVGMSPINTLLLAILFHLEHATLRKALGILIARSGVVILATSGTLFTHSPTILGDVITYFGPLGFAMYVVLGKRVAGSYDALNHDHLEFHFRRLAPSAHRHSRRHRPRPTFQLARHPVAGMGVHRLHWTIQFHPRLPFLLLAPALPGSFATRLVLLSPAGLRLRPRHHVSGRARLLAGTSGRSLALLGVYWIESARHR
jgi:EamA-like transporter family